MKIRILQIGKLKDNYNQQGFDEFLKRISPFADLEVITLKESKCSKTFEPKQCVKAEAEEILGNLKSGEFLVVLDETGKQKTSVEFADFLAKFKDLGQTITFVIGGAFGLDQRVKDSADLMISFSKMTFTHQMVRLFLLEQIYRGICIVNGKQYHH